MEVGWCIRRSTLSFLVHLVVVVVVLSYMLWAACCCHSRQRGDCEGSQMHLVQLLCLKYAEDCRQDFGFQTRGRQALIVLGTDEG